MKMQKFLIVVDMLNDFIKPSGLLYCGPTASAMVGYVKARVCEYRKAGHTVIFLCDAHEEDDKEFERFDPHAIKGTVGAEIIDTLGYGADGDIRVNKTRYSGFYLTELDNVLLAKDLTPENSVAEVCGVCTSICVLLTTAGLANRNYNVVIHRNCVADFDQEAHSFALGYMDRVFGTTIV